jgi:hypothetical protein
MPTLPQRIAAIEQRQRDAMQAALIAAGSRSDPAEASRRYAEFMNPVWVPTADEVRRSERWNRLTAQEATNVYLATINDPRFDTDKAVARILEGRP